MSKKHHCINCKIRRLSLFKDIPDDALNGVQALRNEDINLGAHEDLFHENITHPNIYSLSSGWGIIYKKVGSSKRQILHFLLPGDLIGFQIKKDDIMTYSVGTITECSFCSFSRADIKSLMISTPELALRLLEMGHRDSSLCQSHLMAAGRKAAKESVAYILLEMFNRVKNQSPELYHKQTNTIDFPLTQEDIGDSIGLTNIHINRVINELMKEKLLRINKKKLTILDESKLMEIAEYS